MSDNISYTVLVLTKEIMKLQEITNIIQECMLPEHINNDKVQEITNKIQELQNNIDYLKEFRA